MAKVRYTSAEIAHAMRVCASFTQAAAEVGMSASAMRARVLKDPELKPIALACWARGRRITRGTGVFPQNRDQPSLTRRVARGT